MRPKCGRDDDELDDDEPAAEEMDGDKPDNDPEDDALLGVESDEDGPPGGAPDEEGPLGGSEGGPLLGAAVDDDARRAARAARPAS